MAVADLGVQSVIVDPTGATVGLWQCGTFSGFTVLGEPARRAGSSCAHATMRPPSTSTLRASVETDVMSDTDSSVTPRCVTRRRGQLAGIMDATGVLAEGVPRLVVYWTR